MADDRRQKDVSPDSGQTVEGSGFYVGESEPMPEAAASAPMPEEVEHVEALHPADVVAAPTPSTHDIRQDEMLSAALAKLEAQGARLAAQQAKLERIASVLNIILAIATVSAVLALIALLTG